MDPRASAFTPAWILHSPYTEPPILHTRRCGGGWWQESTGRHRRTMWGGPEQERPHCSGGMGSACLLRQGRRRSASADLGWGPFSAIVSGGWSTLGLNLASIFTRCVNWGRDRDTRLSQWHCPAWLLLFVPLCPFQAVVPEQLSALETGSTGPPSLRPDAHGNPYGMFFPALLPSRPCQANVQQGALWTP